MVDGEGMGMGMGMGGDGWWGGQRRWEWDRGECGKGGKVR